MNTQRGFTTYELLVVAVLVASLGGVSVAIYKSFTDEVTEARMKFDANAARIGYDNLFNSFRMQGQPSYFDYDGDFVQITDGLIENFAWNDIRFDPQPWADDFCVYLGYAIFPEDTVILNDYDNGWVDDGVYDCDGADYCAAKWGSGFPDCMFIAHGSKYEEGETFTPIPLGDEVYEYELPVATGIIFRQRVSESGTSISFEAGSFRKECDNYNGTAECF